MIQFQFGIYLAHLVENSVKSMILDFVLINPKNLALVGNITL